MWVHHGDAVWESHFLNGEGETMNLEGTFLFFVSRVDFDAAVEPTSLPVCHVV